MHYLLVCFFPRQKMFIFCSLLSVMEAHCNIGVPTVHWGCTPEKCNASVSTDSKAIFPFRVNVTGCRCMWGLQIHRDDTCVMKNGHAMTGFSGLSSGGGTGLAAAHFSDQATTLKKRAQLLPTWDWLSNFHLLLWAFLHSSTFSLCKLSPSE